MPAFKELQSALHEGPCVHLVELKQLRIGSVEKSAVWSHEPAAIWVPAGGRCKGFRVAIVVHHREPRGGGAVCEARLPFDETLSIEGELGTLRRDQRILEVDVEWDANPELLLQVASDEPAGGVNGGSFAVRQINSGLRQHGMVSIAIPRSAS
jgi:hypothetical protein